MAYHLIHYVAQTPDHDYDGLEKALSALGAVQLSEELWLVAIDMTAGDLANSLFRDRPQGDRFLILELKSAVGFAAANLMEDPREALSALLSDPSSRPHSPSVKLFRQGEAPKELSSRATQS